MSTFRSYFLKNNTLITNNVTNNSQNPVTEIFYGTADKIVSRFIFDVDFSVLKDRIEGGFINQNRILKHVLHMVNTINHEQQYVGKKSYSSSVERTSSFDLDIFNIKEEWDEGNGYDFMYDTLFVPEVVSQASNWYSARTNTLWVNAGAYIAGISEIIGSQRFENGSENITIDITDYVNQRLFGTGNTGISVYSGNSYGLGIKFQDGYEMLDPYFRQAVAFYAKNTNTWYEPYIETTIDDVIMDDRNYFYLNKNNNLYLYVTIGGFLRNVIVNSVNIYDYEDNLIMTFSGDSIENVSKGIYKINFSINSEQYSDAVIFKDVWNITVDGRDNMYTNEFYLINQDKYYNLNNSNTFRLSNYFFNFHGIGERENIKAGDIRKINLTVKELYPNQNNYLPLDIEYRLFITISNNYEIDVIPFTPVNRTNTGYEFNLDTSWLIPQDYKLQITLKNGYYQENKQIVSFTIIQ